MKLFKISTLALALALTGWIACGSDSSSDNKTDTAVISGSGGTVNPDAPMGTGGSGGSKDAGISDTAPDAPLFFDVPITVDGTKPSDTGAGIETPSVSVDGGINLCTGLTPTECHLAIINAATDPSVSALDPGPNPAVPYPTCSAQ
jgi:hypothetical protein